MLFKGSDHEDKAVFQIIQAMINGVSVEEAYVLQNQGKLQESKKVLGRRKEARHNIRHQGNIPDPIGLHDLSVKEPSDEIGDIIQRNLWKHGEKGLSFQKKHLAKWYFERDFHLSLDHAEAYLIKAELYVFNPRKSAPAQVRVAKLLARAQHDIKRMQVVIPDNSDYGKTLQYDYKPMQNRLGKCYGRYHDLAEFPDKVKVRIYNLFLETEVCILEQKIQQAEGDRNRAEAIACRRKISDILSDYKHRTMSISNKRQG